MGIEDRVLEKIVPSREEEERLREVVAILKRRLEAEIGDLGIDAHPLLVGSVAKGTHLKNPEIDMFVCFTPSTSRKDLEKYGLMLGESVVGGEKHYAEHPYIMGEFEGFTTEIVPCYKVTDPRKKMSAVDRTPFHTEYVLKNQKEKQKNETRLLKQFAKGTGVYGAEAKVQGLSGYLCELLVLEYGSFRKVLKGASKWRKGAVLELEKKASKKFTEPLIVVDPVDSGRNVASALSLNQFARFIQLSRFYLKNPKMKFFFPLRPKKPTKAGIQKRLKARGTDFLTVAIKKPDMVDDVLYPQIRKAVRSIANLCERNEFVVYDSGFHVLENEILFLIELKSARLPVVRKHKGPTAWVGNVDDFLQKWERSRKKVAGPYVENGHFYFDLKRDHAEAKTLLRRELKNLGLGKNLDEVVSKRFTVLQNEEIISEGYLVPFSMFLEKSIQNPILP
ncbi:MAG: CCA tRNA nucleotidyltransferase [Methanomassiliicoccales archaeon]|nr:MAG: CCA tRNA nucleotidyltransferase [Methanomassiliicoccales archaeon]